MRTRRAGVLYHFTCEHGHEGISRSGKLLPFSHPFLPGLGPLLWLTDIATPSAESVGLTSNLQTCNRRAYRYVVRTRAAVRWSELRGRVDRQTLADMESFGQPERWWVARRPLLASEFSLDETYSRAYLELERVDR